MEDSQKITKPSLDVNPQEYGAVGMPEYQDGDSTYATLPPLDAMKPIGMGHDTTGYHDGVTPIVTVMNADVKNSDTTLNQSYNPENLSKKYKYPQTVQDTGTMYTGQK